MRKKTGVLRLQFRTLSLPHQRQSSIKGLKLHSWFWIAADAAMTQSGLKVKE
jgi:hypothetical protein